MLVLRPIRNTPIQSEGRAYNFFEVKLVTMGCEGFNSYPANVENIVSS